MAKRQTSIVVTGLFAVVGGLVGSGCAQTSPMASMVPQPSFAPPQVIVKAPLATTPTAVAIAPSVPHPTVHVRPPMAIPSPSVPTTPSTESTPAVAYAGRDWLPPVPARPWRWIVIHHSDTTTGGAAAFDKMHRAKGWDELGYDFVIGNGTDTADGLVEVGPRWVKQKIGAHAKTPDNRFNEYGVGICLVGNMMVQHPTAKQLRSTEKLVAFLMKTYHIPVDHVLGHGMTKPTDCPGRYTDVFAIRRAAAVMAGMPTATSSGPYGEMLTDTRH